MTPDEKDEPTTAGPAEAAAGGIDPASAAEDAGPVSGAAEIDRLAELEAEVKRLTEESLRVRAEADNIRKRAQRDVEAAHKYGLERFVADLLPVKDSLDLGYSAAERATDVEPLLEGMALTRKMLNDVLEKAGVRELNPEGERFDPEFHQAMSMEASSDHPPGTVLRVVQKGFALNERLVRPALVVVTRQVTDVQA